MPAGLLVCLLAVQPASAQSVGASLSGTVYDELRNVLPGASLALKSLDSGQLRTTVTDSLGAYRFVGLAPAVYEVTVALAGFATATRSDLRLSIGQEARLDVVLAVARLTQTVTVMASDLTLIETSKTALGRTLTTSDIEQLPIPGRTFSNFAALATLVPGILTDANTLLTGITTAAQTGTNNTFLLDGVVIDDALNAGLRGGVPLDAIKEYVVLSSGFTAEHGQASGAVVDVVTRSGTNRHQGRGFFYGEDGRLNATPATARLANLSQQKPESKQQIVGAFLGGPIHRDRAFYFASGEQVVDDATYIDVSPVIGRFRPTDPLAVPVRRRNPKLFGRADVHVRPHNTFTVSARVANDLVTNAMREPVTPSAAERGMDAFDRVRDVTALDTHVVGRQGVNEMRFQFGRRQVEFNVESYCPGCPALNYPSILLGKRVNAPQFRTEHRWQLADAVTYLVSSPRWGEHAVKAGVDVNAVRETSFFPFNFNGTFTFKSNDVFDPANQDTYPTLYTRNEGDPLVRLRDDLVSVFAQDQWKPKPTVTVNAGVRWDHEESLGLTQKNTVAPRLGVAVDPTGSGKTVIRAGYGRYYDHVQLAIPRDAKNGFLQTFIVNPGYPDPFGPNPKRTDQVPPSPATTRFASQMRTPFTERASLGFEREWLGHLAVAADVVWARGHDLLESHDVNYPDLTDRNRTRPDASFQRVTVVESRGHSWYQGLQIGLRKTSSSRYSYSLAYTWSKSERDTQEFRFFPQDQRDFGADRGPADGDSRHRLSASANNDLPLGFRLAAVVTARSSLPYTVTTGRDDNRDTINNDRPPGVGRNSARGSALLSVDARLSKRIRSGRPRIELLAEAFNLTNRINWIAYDGNQRSVTFGRPVAAANPRLLQFGIRVDF